MNHDLLYEVSFALAQGGLSWVDRACAKLRDKNRFSRMEAEGWDEEGNAENAPGGSG